MLTHRSPQAQPPGRVVVLGGSGFVGREILRQLGAAGIDTVGTSSSDVDLSEAAAVDRLVETVRPDDSLVLVSALTPDKGRDIATLMKNLRMVEHVCAALARARCAHLVYISSDAVYADDANPVRETSACDPSSFHGVMHLTRERMLAHTAKAAGIPLAVLRPTLLYGAGDTHNGYGPNRFVRTALASAAITLFGNGEEKRDHVHAADLAALTALVLAHQSEGVLNVATGQSTSFFEVAQIIRASLPAVEVICQPRQNPVTHRHFDVTGLARTFPSFQFTPLGAGLGGMVRAVATT